MNESEGFLNSLRRQWLIFVLVVLLATIAAALGALASGVSYSRSASQLLLPGSASYPTGDNPFIYTSTLTQSADVLVGAMNSQAVLIPLQRENPGVQLTFARAANTSAPIVEVSAVSKSDVAAAKAIRDSTSTATRVLASLQARTGVPERARLHLDDISVDGVSSVNLSGLVRTAGLILVPGLVLAAVLALLADRRLPRTKMTRAAH